MSHGDNDTQLGQPLGQVTWAGRFMTSRSFWSTLSATGSDTGPKSPVRVATLPTDVGRKPLGVMAPDSADRDCTGRRSVTGRWRRKGGWLAVGANQREPGEELLQVDYLAGYELCDCEGDDLGGAVVDVSDQAACFGAGQPVDVGA